MKHIREILNDKLKLIRKAKFYHHNRDIFLKYFENVDQYQALILAGNFEKMEEIIKNNSSFNFDEFVINFKN